MLTCKEVTRLVSESLDHKLTLRQRFQIYVHFRMCGVCDHFRKQVDFVQSAVQRFGAMSDSDLLDPPQLSPEAKARIKESIREESH